MPIVRRLGLLAVAALVVPGGCSGSGDGPVVEIVAEDFSFQVPETIPAGLVRMRLDNQGSVAHAAQLYRLDDGADVDDFVRAMRTGIESERAVATVLGGPANTDAGETGPVIQVLLEPGVYVVVCWLLEFDGTAHAFLGMWETFRVTGPLDEDPPPPPAEGTFELAEYEIGVPPEFDGTGTFRVVNRGGEWHELVIVELDEDQTAQGALLHLTGVRPRTTPPFASRGGLTALEVDGGAGTVELDLNAGRYVFLCAVPNADEVYHANLGMWLEVEIE